MQLKDFAASKVGHVMEMGQWKLGNGSLLA